MKRHKPPTVFQTIPGHDFCSSVTQSDTSNKRTKSESLQKEIESKFSLAQCFDFPGELGGPTGPAGTAQQLREGRALCLDTQIVLLLQNRAKSGPQCTEMDISTAASS